MTPPICPYCQQPSLPATGKDLYPHRPDLFYREFFWCQPCDAYVGTHNRTGEPLGTLANKRLRKLRNAAHAAFDPVWMEQVNTALEKDHRAKLADLRAIYRTRAYCALATALAIPVEDCHIAQFDETTCQQVIDICNSREIYRFLA